MTLVLLLLAVVAAGVGFLAGRVGGRRSTQREASSWLKRARARTQKLSSALVGARREQQRVVDLLGTLPEVINKLRAARTTRDLGRTSTRAIVDLTRARRVGLFLPTSSSSRFSLELLIGATEPEGGVEIEAGQGRLGSLAALDGVNSQRDLGDSVARVSPADELFAPELCVAMRHHEQTHAFIAMDGVGSVDDVTLLMVQLIADVHAVAAPGVATLEREQLESGSIEDPLTEVGNRAYFDRRFPVEVVRARSYGMPLSLFLFSVDGIHRCSDPNDREARERCLRGVARFAQAVTRSSDLVCRYSEDEFAVLLLGADRMQAWSHAERIRKAVGEIEVPAGEPAQVDTVSISGGVACFPHDGASSKSLLALADEALERAKRAGGNQVATASTPES